MYAYHIDRHNSLIEGQTVNLNKYPSGNAEFTFFAEKMFPQGISQHGYNYMCSTPKNSIQGETSFTIMEFELELIRRSFFSNMPSRYQSFFAVESIENIRLWLDIITSPFKVYKIEFSKSQYEQFDSQLLNLGLLGYDPLSYSPCLDFSKAFAYWSQQSTPDPRYELLITPPIKVLKEIPVVF